MGCKFLGRYPKDHEVFKEGSWISIGGLFGPHQPPAKESGSSVKETPNRTDRIARRLKKPFTKILFRSIEGIVRAPKEEYFSVYEWLSPLFEDDEESMEQLADDPMQFVEDRWTVETLLELDWMMGMPASSLVITAMHVGGIGYVLVWDENEHTAMALVEPFEGPALVSHLITDLITSGRYIDHPPSHFKNFRPDLIADSAIREAIAALPKRR